MLLILEATAEHGIDQDPILEASFPKQQMTVLEEFFEVCEAFAEKLAEDIGAAPISGVRFLSAGPHLWTAAYGAAKIVELTRLPVWSEDIEEFAHRQFWSMERNDLVVYLASRPAVATTAASSSAALADFGVRTAAVEGVDCRVPTAPHRLVLPGLPEWTGLLLVPVVLQFLAYHLALAVGLNPNTRSHLIEDERRFETSRKLTRRSLLGTGK